MNMKKINEVLEAIKEQDEALYKSIRVKVLTDNELADCFEFVEIKDIYYVYYAVLEFEGNKDMKKFTDFFLHTLIEKEYTVYDSLKEIATDFIYDVYGRGVVEDLGYVIDFEHFALDLIVDRYIYEVVDKFVEVRA